MIDSTTWRMADRLAHGRLEAIIASHRANGLSADAISRRLHADHGIDVAGRTIARWIIAAALDDDEPLDAA